MGPQDSNFVIYSASYKDARVARIAYTTDEWRDEDRSLVYALKNKASQASLRKTVSLEAELLEYYVCKFKQLDLELLRQLVRLLETMDESSIDRNEVDVLLNEFRQVRNKNIASLLKEIDQGKIIDSNGTLQKEAQLIVNGDKSDSAEKGGIDLNSVQIERTGHVIEMQFDPVQLERLMQGPFEGFMPVIIDIQHMPSPFELLGINQSEKESELLAKI